LGYRSSQLLVRRWAVQAARLQPAEVDSIVKFYHLTIAISLSLLYYANRQFEITNSLSQTLQRVTVKFSHLCN
jgi:hypothetical protein